MTFECPKFLKKVTLENCNTHIDKGLYEKMCNGECPAYQQALETENAGAGKDAEVATKKIGCTVEGCPREGDPRWNGKCKVHHMQSFRKPKGEGGSLNKRLKKKSLSKLADKRKALEEQLEAIKKQEEEATATRLYALAEDLVDAMQEIGIKDWQGELSGFVVTVEPE